jgi:hypothetical protein
MGRHYAVQQINLIILCVPLNGLMSSPFCERCLKKQWISLTHPMHLWGHSSFKISSAGPLLYGTRWLPRHPCERLHFIWSVGLLEGWNRGGSTIDHWRLQCKGWSRPIPYAFIHSFIHVFHWQVTFQHQSADTHVCMRFLFSFQEAGCCQ